MEESSPAAVLVGHGSSTSGDSAAPVYRYARRLDDVFDLHRLARKTEAGTHRPHALLDALLTVPRETDE